MASCGLENLLQGSDRHRLRIPGLEQPLHVSERTIRRIITLIAILAIIVLALSLTLHFAAQYAGVQQSQRQQLLTLLRLAGHGLNDVTRSAGTARMPTRSDLMKVLPDFALDNGRVFILAGVDDTARVILAAEKEPLKGLREGAPLPGFLHASPETETASLRVVRDAAGEPVLTGSMPLATWPGRLLVAQPAGRMNGLWRSSANMLASLFIGLFIVMVGLISVYNWQAAQAERARRERSRFIDRLEKALTLGRCGLWDWDVARGRIYLSSSMRGLLGLPELDGYIDMADFIVLQHPEEKPVDVLLEEGLEAGNDTFEHEIRLRKADGDWLWLKLRGALPAREGNVSESRHLVGIAVDITAQKKAAAAMRSAEQRLLSAIESLSESFVLWNEQMRMVMCNSKFREFHGLPENACRSGLAYADIMRQARHPIRNRHLKHIYSDGPEQENIMELEMADGRWLQISERTMPDGSLVSVGTDITELKAKQLELEQSQRELQETVEALQQSRREIESQNERLKDMARRAQRAQQRAEEALRTKSQFLANVSHELFTPLNHILGPADAMRAQALGRLPAQYLEYAEKIHESGKEMQRKIRDMLEFAQLSTGDGELRTQETDLERLIAETAEEFLPQAREQGLGLKWRVQPGLRARVDGERLRQMLRQLVSNAVRFTERGEVSLSAETRAGRILVIEVRDTGIGIPQEKIALIGRPFERTGNAYNSHRGGSGIGLAIAKIIAELHGGKLEITSEEGRGTRVACIIPLRSGENTRNASAQNGGDEAGDTIAPRRMAARG